MKHFKFENWRIGEFDFWCYEQVKLPPVTMSTTTIKTSTRTQMKFLKSNCSIDFPRLFSLVKIIFVPVFSEKPKIEHQIQIYLHIVFIKLTFIKWSMTSMTTYIWKSTDTGREDRGKTEGRQLIYSLNRRNTNTY